MLVLEGICGQRDIIRGDKLSAILQNNLSIRNRGWVIIDTSRVKSCIRIKRNIPAPYHRTIKRDRRIISVIHINQNRARITRTTIAGINLCAIIGDHNAAIKRDIARIKTARRLACNQRALPERDII